MPCVLVLCESRRSWWEGPSPSSALTVREKEGLEQLRAGGRTPITRVCPQPASPLSRFCRGNAAPHGDDPAATRLCPTARQPPASGHPTRRKYHLLPQNVPLLASLAPSATRPATARALRVSGSRTAPPKPCPRWPRPTCFQHDQVSRVVADVGDGRDVVDGDPEDEILPVPPHQLDVVGGQADHGVVLGGQLPRELVRSLQRARVPLKSRTGCPWVAGCVWGRLPEVFSKASLPHWGHLGREDPARGRTSPQGPPPKPFSTRGHGAGAAGQQG